ncbi:unknown protein [Seminavis robusta]|uniref:Uncharacterized protein n=1 Tax=Seminavis robusta TaxID=568900 RepID=A0A9N8F3U0_9STRA|nr:unknown protein [Seminavis robusta]|eukprot:Sro3100_g343750.1 n/a (152) ;mRNA; r:5942-6550
MASAEEEERDKKWESSEAKELLKQDLISGDIPLSWSAAMAYKHRPEFKKFEESRFTNNFYTLRAKLEKDYKRVETDSVAFEWDLVRLQELREENPPPKKPYPDWWPHKALRFAKKKMRQKYTSAQPRDTVLPAETAATLVEMMKARGDEEE